MYWLGFDSQVASDLKRLDSAARRRILAKCEWLAENALDLPHEALVGTWGGSSSSVLEIVASSIASIAPRDR